MSVLFVHHLGLAAEFAGSAQNASAEPLVQKSRISFVMAPVEH